MVPVLSFALGFLFQAVENPPLRHWIAHKVAYADVPGPVLDLGAGFVFVDGAGKGERCLTWQGVVGRRG